MMRFAKATLLFGLLTMMAATAFAQGEGEVQSDAFSLDEAVEYAMENNLNIRNTTLEESIAKAEIGDIRATGLPQVNVNVDMNYNYELRKTFVDPSNFPGGGTGDGGGEPGEDLILAFGTKYDGTAAINVSQLIFDGSYFVGLRAARTYRELSAKESIRTRIETTEMVTKAYYGVLVSQERIKLVDENYERLDTLLRETSALYENGFAEKIDVDRIRVQYNNIRTERTRAARLHELNKDLLKFQMGYPVSQPIALKDSLSRETFAEGVDNIDDFNYNDRIEYSQLQTNLDLAELDLKNNKVQYLPNLSAIFNYGYNTGSGSFDQMFTWNRWLNYGVLGLRLNVPVFDGLRKSYRIQKNRIQQEQVQNRMVLLENSIDLEMNRSATELQNALDVLDNQTENLELAREVYRVSKIKYEEGIGSNLEVVEAETDLRTAEVNYYTAMYDALIAKVDRQVAQGTLYEE
ncbi:MAG: TolC family protein [Cyclobacteriaceae bacterium]